jgi:Zn-dependent protease
MLNKKEIAHIIIITIILAFSISLIQSMELFIITLGFVFLIIMANTLSKKVVGYYFEAEVETRLWEMERYGFLGAIIRGFYHPSRKFKQAIPLGAIMPIVVKVLSLGYINWMASLVFDVKAKKYRAAKRHGFYSFSEMTEFHIGLIAAAGILMNLLLAIVGYLIGATEFARLNIYYAFFNMIPLSSLDGNKIFFGSLLIWSFLISIILIGIGFAFFVI